VKHNIQSLINNLNDNLDENIFNQKENNMRLNIIDTVILLISQEDFKILDYEVFCPSARGIFEPPYYKLSKGSFNCIQYPTKQDLITGNYKPRLTLSKRLVCGGYSIALKIEFSAPKLLFGNNFEELENNNFEAVILKLHQKLEEMGILIDVEKLKFAQVTGVHFGKNIILKNATSSLVINTIKKLDISRRLDSGDTDYRNEGQAIRYHTNSYELTFYDKMKDLEQAKITEKRATEKDNLIQLELFTKEEILKNEVLRMEVRLNTKKKLREIFIKNNYNLKNPTFHSIFNVELSRLILNYFWQEYIVPSLNIVLLAKESPDVLYHKAKSIDITENKTLQIVGALQLINDCGCRRLKSFLSAPVFYRLKQDIERFEVVDNYLYSVFKSVQTNIQSNNRCKIDDLYFYAKCKA